MGKRVNNFDPIFSRNAQMEKTQIGQSGKVLKTGIQGVLLEPLAVIPTANGPVLKMISPANTLLPDFSSCFGEVYFSVVDVGRVKAWKRHRRQTQYFAVPYGRLKIVLYDSRIDSPTENKLIEFVLGLPDNYALLKIPPGIWYGFAAQGKSRAMICNCSDIPHDPEEGERLPLDAPQIPFSWKSAE